MSKVYHIPDENLHKPQKQTVNYGKEDWYSVDFIDSPNTCSNSDPAKNDEDKTANEKSEIFPSIRFLMAILLALCFTAISVSSNNISVSSVCMMKSKAESSCEEKMNETMNATKTCTSDNWLDWTSTIEGIFFAGQNIGALIMLFFGSHVNRLNSKWTISGSVSLVIFSNIIVAALSLKSFIFGILGRIFVGLADMLLQISSSSMLMGWFPPKERCFAIGLITGGRQLGMFLIKETMHNQDHSLIIYPIGGYLCASSVWQMNFYISAGIGAGVLIIWIALSADRPQTQLCMSKIERKFIEDRIEVDSGGFKKKNAKSYTPWRAILTSGPLHAAVWGIICHEYPMMLVLTSDLVVLNTEWTMMNSIINNGKNQKRFDFIVNRTLTFCESTSACADPQNLRTTLLADKEQFRSDTPLSISKLIPIAPTYPLLPQYLKSSFNVEDSILGYVSAGLTFVFWISKTLSSALSSYIGSRKKGRFVITQTMNVKIFNFIASLGLGVCLGLTPIFQGWIPTIVFMAAANAFAGCHTPGVFTALLQLAPAYTGIITGISYGLVSLFSIFNKIMSFTLLGKGNNPWVLLFEISAGIALFQVIFFTIWGSAERQPWADLSYSDDDNDEDESEAMRKYSMSLIVMDYSQLPKKLSQLEKTTTKVKPSEKPLEFLAKSPYPGKTCPKIAGNGQTTSNNKSIRDRSGPNCYIYTLLNKY